MEREVVYVYNEQRALEILEREGDSIELHCVKSEMRICSSDDEVKKFYSGKQDDSE